jgi:hypothetical protein
MRQTISGLFAIFAVAAASTAPAMACGGIGLFEGGCSPCGQSYVSPCAQSYVPAPVYSGCNSGCGGWAYERLPDPVQQYYYVNQGPTYTGPGNFAPYPTYQEGAVSDWGVYRHRYYYGQRHSGYRYQVRPGVRYGYESRHGYASHHSMRYGYRAPHHYGYREHTLRRYY